MKILITGGAGFIGSAVVRRAVAEAERVVRSAPEAVAPHETRFWSPQDRGRYEQARKAADKAAALTV